MKKRVRIRLPRPCLSGEMEITKLVSLPRTELFLKVREIRLLSDEVFEKFNCQYSSNMRLFVKYFLQFPSPPVVFYTIMLSYMDCAVLIDMGKFKI